MVLLLLPLLLPLHYFIVRVVNIIRSMHSFFLIDANRIRFGGKKCWWFARAEPLIRASTLSRRIFSQLSLGLL